MDKIKIRIFNEEDAEAVIALWRRCNLVVPWNDPQKDIARKLAHSPELFFVAEREQNIVGVCMAGYDGHRGWIYYLGVEPELQRQGIAAKLMTHAETVLGKMDCPKIDLMVRDANQPVIDFYQRVGYKKDPVWVLSKRLIDD